MLVSYLQVTSALEMCFDIAHGLDLGHLPYILHGVKYIDLVSLQVMKMLDPSTFGAQAKSCLGYSICIK